MIALYFPAMASEEMAGTQSEPALQPPPRELHIMYVDDDETLVFLAGRVLRKYGYRVSGYTDPQRALEEFRTRAAEFDGVVTDMVMPRINGEDVARGVLEVRPDIAVVLMTGHVRPADLEAAQRLGLQDVIRKPQTAEEFARILEGRVRRT